MHSRFFFFKLIVVFYNIYLLICVQEASPEGGQIQLYFEELLKSNKTILVEELLLEHFSDLIKFVKTRACKYLHLFNLTMASWDFSVCIDC
ncbi:unnamed protein product, partial [Vitis vinifera]|uniref:Uncharacterized protein n=1 Tax=Vitis vinifera TaxID=29760 RepID=D7T200_VITVI